jgi:hypothetical protein
MIIYGIIAVCSMLVFTSCSTNLAGGSSDHGNAKVLGVISDTTGTGVESAFVRLLPEHYNPVLDDFPADSLTAVTDRQGYFEIENIVEDIYCLTGVGPAGELFCIEKSITVDSGSVNTINATLLKPGSVKAPLRKGTWQGNTKISIYIPGTNIYKTVEHNIKEAYLDNVPGGIHSLWVYKHDENSAVLLHEDYKEFSVIPDIIMDFTIVPVKPNGPGSVMVNEECRFFTMFEYWNIMPDINVEHIEYRFSWGDRDTSDWVHALGHSHRWSKEGSFYIRVQLRYLPDIIGAVNPSAVMSFYSGWSGRSRIEIKP